ncbi:hypothetical protein JEQ12_011607 [Ovis aries]|uniref:60S ribosomal protein L32 n=1 Tax=Ovis aries TaxID=9940 RepID=A0A836CUH2_SHEEP|nr:hypothetical protein JEQ12_011607 [Ovis aries]
MRHQESKRELFSLGAAYEGGSHLLLGILATLIPLMKPKIIKKRTKKFIWHQGIDTRLPRRFRGHILMPNIGYGPTRKQSTCCPVASRSSCLVYNLKQLETAHNISSKDRRTTEERAAQLAIRVPKPNARLHSQENDLCGHLVHTFCSY